MKITQVVDITAVLVMSLFLSSCANKQLVYYQSPIKDANEAATIIFNNEMLKNKNVVFYPDSYNCRGRALLETIQPGESAKYKFEADRLLTFEAGTLYCLSVASFYAQKGETYKVSLFQANTTCGFSVKKLYSNNHEAAVEVITRKYNAPLFDDGSAAFCNPIK